MNAMDANLIPNAESPLDVISDLDNFPADMQDAIESMMKRYAAAELHKLAGSRNVRDHDHVYEQVMNRAAQISR